MKGRRQTALKSTKKFAIFEVKFGFVAIKAVV
jgi:hypothetical protein